MESLMANGFALKSIHQARILPETRANLEADFFVVVDEIW